MWNTKLCLNILSNNIPIDEQLALFKKTGFDGFFLCWEDGIDLEAIKSYADSIGMHFQSVHAPFLKSADMWRGGECAKVALEELLRCLNDVANASVKIMVCHAWIGFDTNESPSECGVENYRVLVERAKELGVKIAFENTEGEEFLARLFEEFSDYDNVGFCLDTGHEMCYNRSQDMLALYGERLIATHINDNLGINDFNGAITFLDDLHLLPFDGIKNWDVFAKRIRKCGYENELTFELKIENRHGRHEKDSYEKMTFEEYLAEAYKRACRVAALIKGY